MASPTFPRRVLAVLAAGALALVVAPPAGATIIDGGHYSGTDSFTYDDCGFLIEVDVEFSGVFNVRKGKGKQASAFFLTDNFEFFETHTNPANGESFTVEGNRLFKETRATRISGNVFRFTAVDAGTLVYRDADGNLVARNTGNARVTILFDTLGDDMPGGNFVDFLSERLNGNHVDHCEIATALIG